MAPKAKTKGSNAKNNNKGAGTGSAPEAPKAPVVPTIALVGIEKIREATASEAGFIFIGIEEAKALAAQGLTESNPNVPNTPDGYIATRALSITTDTGGKMDSNSNTASTAETFEIETNVPRAPRVHRGGNFGPRDSKYPFEKLELGQSFFIAGKEPKDLASTVANANKRFATVKTDENGKPVTRAISRGPHKGQTTEVLVYSRYFAVEKSEKNGVKGSRVFRVEVPEKRAALAA